MLPRRELNVDKTKVRKKSWLGPSHNTIRDRIVSELESYNIPVGMDSTNDKTNKGIAKQIYGMDKINRMNIPLISLVLAIRNSPAELYQDNVDVYVRKILALKDIPSEKEIRESLQIDIVRYNKAIDNYIRAPLGIYEEEADEEEENYEEEDEYDDDEI